MSIKLQFVGSALDRTRVSDKITTIIANGTLPNVGLISDGVRRKKIDRMKIRRQRIGKNRKRYVEESKKLITEIEELFFCWKKTQN